MGARGRAQVLGVTVVGTLLAFLGGAASAGVLNDALKVSDVTNGVGQSQPTELTAAGNNLFFVALSSGSGYELWKTNGTAAGTVKVREINNGGDSFPSDLTNVNGTLYFTAENGANGSDGLTGLPNIELWRSDGTTAGTEIVKEINLGGSAGPAHLTNVNGTLFFSANDGTGRELWKSNGTAAGTTPVTTLGNPGNGGSYPSELAKVGDLLYFTAFTNENGWELYKSDGTSSGTTIVTDINPGTGPTDSSQSPAGITDVNGTAYFSADNGTDGRELFKSNGSSASQVANLRPGGSSNPTEITPVGSTIYFKANDGTTGNELFKTDGTSIALVKDIRDPGGSNPSDLTNVGGTLLFTADESTTGIELWRSDGTPGGTTVVKNINPGGVESTPTDLTEFGGSLYFSADNGTNGFEPWRSDGTSDGTVMVRDVNPTAGAGSNPRAFTPFQGGLHFSAFDTSPSGIQIWKLADTVPPSVTIGSGPASGSTITTASATFGFSSDDQPATFECRVYPTGSTPPAFGPCSGSGTHTTAALANGSYTFDVQGADIGGNTDTDSRNFTVAVPSPPQPPGGDSAACEKTRADLEAAEKKLDKAKAALKKAKKSKKAAKIKKAKAKIKKAKAKVKAAKSEVADAC